MSAQRMMPPRWLHDDTEEDLVGADWHQEAIRSLVFSLRDLAYIRGWPWHVGDQLTLVAWAPDGGPWRPSPDVMIHPQAGSTKRSEIVAREEGVPALVIEVASPSTWEYDANVREGKAWAYLHLGVPNYLIFDPHGDLLGEQCRGWQRRGDTTRAWRPGIDGRYHTLTLDVSFQPEGDLLRVFDPDGRPVAFNFEKMQRIQAQQQELSAQQQELAAQARRIAELKAELDRLRGQG